jgi:hypothetical protein
MLSYMTDVVQGILTAYLISKVDPKALLEVKIGAYLLPP